MLLLNQLAADIDKKLAPNEYEFRPGHGTVDATGAVMDIAKEVAKGVVQDRHLGILVTLDVRNAFKSMPWLASY